jgi:N-acetylglucosaminyl-diphospho-decaprenol L-rhamnosyltransferase
MRIAVVIVNYRTPGLVRDCLDSLRGEVEAGLDLRVFVGDADSGDGSVDSVSAHIRDRGYDWAECYAIGVNGGFAYGNNHIVRTRVAPDASFDLIHFLNPDTVIRPGAVRALAEFLKATPGAGVAGSRLENPDASLRAYAFRFPTPWREFFRGARIPKLDTLAPATSITFEGLQETRPVDWVTGASFMIRRGLLDEVGLMDDGYFLYFEETDFIRRIRKAGWEAWHVAESRVVHLAGQSTGVRRGDPDLKRLSPHWLRSRQKYFTDHHGRAAAIAATGLFLAGDVLYRAHRLLRLRAVADPPALWRDYLRHGFARPSQRS